MKLFYASCLVALTVTALASCGNNQKQDVDMLTFDANEILSSNDRADHSMKRDSSDTEEIMKLTKEYLDFQKSGQYASAVSMLVAFNPKDTTISTLDDEATKRMMRKMQIFPVKNYEINNVRFYSDLDTEVSYTINKDLETEGPSSAMNCVISFRKVDGVWHPTLIDANYTY